MKTFQLMLNRASEWVGVIFSCAMIFFFLVQLILLIDKI